MLFSDSPTPYSPYAKFTTQVCPANWNPGDETIKATPEGNKAYLGKVHADTKMSDVAKTNGEFTLAVQSSTVAHDGLGTS
jgi:hypothetical protein